MTPEQEAVRDALAEYLSEAMRSFVNAPHTERNRRALERLMRDKVRALCAEAGIDAVPPVFAFSDPIDLGICHIHTPQPGTVAPSEGATYLGRFESADLYVDANGRLFACLDRMVPICELDEPARTEAFRRLQERRARDRL